MMGNTVEFNFKDGTAIKIKGSADFVALVGSQSEAEALLQHFGSPTVFARASLEGQSQPSWKNPTVLICRPETIL
jgi:hypothetical protein